MLLKGRLSEKKNRRHYGKNAKATAGKCNTLVRQEICEMVRLAVDEIALLRFSVPLIVFHGINTTWPNSAEINYAVSTR